MGIKDIPVSAIATSALKALTATHTKAVLIVWDSVTGAQHVLSNHQNGVAMARAALSVNDGAIETAAVALHSFRVKPEGADAVPPEMDKCAFCGGTEPWDKLDDAGREGHRLVTNIVLAAALSHPAPAGGVKV